MDTLELPVIEAAPSVPSTPGAAGPRHRAPIGVRLAFGLMTCLAGLSTAALLLSDRAPGALRAVFGDAARELWARVDADRRATIEATGATAQPDVVVHIAIWLVVTLLLALTIWTWRGVVLATVVATAASVALEFGQRRWADTRSFEVGDLVANLVGVSLGAVTALVVIAIWASVAGSFERRRVARRGGRP